MGAFIDIFKVLFYRINFIISANYIFGTKLSRFFDVSENFDNIFPFWTTELLNECYLTPVHE